MPGNAPERPLNTTKAAVSIINLMSEISELSIANLGQSGQQWLQDLSKTAVVGSIDGNEALVKLLPGTCQVESDSEDTQWSDVIIAGSSMPGRPKGCSAWSGTAVVRS